MQYVVSSFVSMFVVGF